MRFFNTAGPVNPDDHYCIPPLERFDLDEVLALVRMKKYFVLHALRQTGKTSALLALRDLLDGQGYACVYTTVETARTARDDVERAMRVVLSGLGSDAQWHRATTSWPGTGPAFSPSSARTVPFAKRRFRGCAPAGVTAPGDAPRKFSDRRAQ